MNIGRHTSLEVTQALAQNARKVVLGSVRRGHRTVLWTEPKIGLGNFLYHWMQVFTRQSRGQDIVALHIPEMDPWLPYFPGVADRWLIDRSEVRITDRREPGFFQGWAIHYVESQLRAFCDELRRVSTLPLQRRDDPAGRVVVNIRRGDYYSPEFAPRYSIDTSAYLRVALDRALRLGGPITEVHVVSDGVPWCREHLGWIRDEIAPLTFARENATAAEDFTTLATARRLVLTHTTFGYWAAHLSNSVYADNEDLVVAPWFHDRTIAGGVAYHLNPSWTVVRHIPGGWVPEPEPPALP